MRPVLLATNHAPPSRIKAFALLLERHPVELALFGGRSTHAVAAVSELGFPARRVAPRELYALAASGDYSAVVGTTNGRVALPATYLGARRAGVPFVLWATMWSHPRTLAGIAGGPVVRHVYAHADSVATYGPHVSAYVRARGARRVFVAPQAVDNDFWGAHVPATARGDGARFLFAGRDDPAKGLDVLRRAWAESGAEENGATLSVVRDLPAERLRAQYAAADVLVVPSVETRTFREPWALVVNEAMNQGTAVIASDAVGAAAGGLVRDGRNGLVVPAGDVRALAGALLRLAGDAELRERLGAAARRDVQAYSYEAWVDGMWAAVSAACG